LIEIRPVKRVLFLLFAIHGSSAVFSQYWQQQVSYNIDVSLNDKDNSLKGFLNLEYVNNSPDTLQFIWFHLWPNAYKNETTAFAKQIFRESDGKRKWKSLTDKGWIDSLNFEVDGQKAGTDVDTNNIDIIKLLLPSPLQPHRNVTITTPFYVKLPTYISRSGHINQSYMICQWYPKPAVYDSKGWHPIPYLETGEFYSEYGKFTVNITVPSRYVIGATGTMQNEDELRHYKDIGGKNRTLRTNDTYGSPPNKIEKTLTFKAENIHDFAWFADKDFIIEYDTMQMKSGSTIDVFTYHTSHGNSPWNHSVSYVKDAVRHYSAWIGEYPYPVVQAVEGPRNFSSGGMEYPMITLITEPGANEEKLDATIAHEVGHNWFYAALGTNERDHAWMDEGMNTFFEFRYEHEKYRNNSLFGNAIPEDARNAPTDQMEAAIYLALDKLPMESPIDLPSQAYRNDEEYGDAVYLKAALWMKMLELALGRDEFDLAMKNYFSEWEFRHPYPEDFEKSLEQSTGKGLQAYFELLKKEGNLE